MAKAKSEVQSEESVLDIFTEWRKEKKLAADHEEAASLLKRKLESMIRKGSTKEGIVHKVVPHTSVSYAKAWQAVMAKVLKGAQREAATVVLEENTSHTERSDFVLAVED